MSRRSRIAFGAAERKLFARLRSPRAIQDWLDATPYNTQPVYLCPRSVMRERRAHCFDGAVFAAAALERLGFPPLLLDLAAVRDDDHVLALYRVRGHWGAVAKSNFTTLRFREPVYRTLRELALSYFDFYYNLEGEKTLRSYSGAVRLSRFEGRAWRTRDAAMDEIAAALYAARHWRLVPRGLESGLSRVDARLHTAGLAGADPAGLYRA